MASDRHQLRALVVQSLFAWEFRGGDAEAILNYNMVNGYGTKRESTYASNLLKKILLHRSDLKIILARFAPEWPFEKIAPIDRAILELGITELMYEESIPDLVAINEAIELAKEFGVESSSKFINGVLSSIYDDKKTTANKSN